MSDIFEEVEEDYRVEQLLRFWRENAVKLIIIMVLTILIGASTSFYRVWHEHKIEEQTRRLADALDKPGDLEALIPSLTGHRKIAGELALARQKAGDHKDEAIKLYDRIASDGAASRAEQGLAEIASIGLQLDTADPAALSDRLKKLSGDKDPYRFSAMEWQGLLDVKQGKIVDAHNLFAAIAADSAAPDNLQQRAMALAQLYPGE